MSRLSHPELPDAFINKHLQSTYRCKAMSQDTKTKRSLPSKSTGDTTSHMVIGVCGMRALMKTEKGHRRSPKRRYLETGQMAEGHGSLLEDCVMVFCPPEMEEAKLHGGGEEKPDSKSSKGSEETVSTVFWEKLWLIQPKQGRNKAVRVKG